MNAVVVWEGIKQGKRRNRRKKSQTLFLGLPLDHVPDLGVMKKAKIPVPLKEIHDTGADPGFWSVRGPSRVLTPRGALSQKFAQNRGFSLKIA